MPHFGAARPSLLFDQAERAGRPFILTLWSARCTHCPAELKVLGDLARQYPGLDIVLLSTDSPAETGELAALAESYGLGRKAQWVFADAQPEKLRFAIDRRWYGELPRTYFFDAGHRREAVSGLVSAERLQRWVGEHLK